MRRNLILKRLVACLSCVLSFHHVFNKADNEGLIPIHIRSFIPYDSLQTSQEFAKMQEAATAHVNSLQGLLDGYQLCYSWNWTLDATSMLSTLYDYVHKDPTISMLFGPPFSALSALVNPVAEQYHLIQVTTSNSPALGDLSRYAYTVQIFPDENECNPGRIGFLKLFGWKRAAVVFEDVEFFRSNMEHLTVKLREARIDVQTIEAISDTDNPDQHILSLLRHDARILIIGAYRGTIVNLACKAYEYGLYGAKYVWFITGWLVEGKLPWHQAENIPCDPRHVAEVLEGSIYIHMMRLVERVEDVDFKGIKPNMKQKEYLTSVLNEDPVALNVLRHFYDGIFVMAMTLNSSIEQLKALDPPRTLEDFAYSDDRMGHILVSNVRNLDFTALTGRVLINQTRDPMGLLLYISQYIGGKIRQVCYFDHTGDQVTWFANQSFLWKENMVPVDGMTYQPHIIDVSATIRVSFLVISCLGIIGSLVFLYVNVKYKNHKIMKTSSPPLNNFVVVGGILLYLSVLLIGIDRSEFQDLTLVTICYVQLVCLCLGMSLSLGALFMKTYRIKTIFQSSSSLKRVKLPDRTLVKGVLSLVLLDIVVIGLWIFQDTMFIGKYLYEPRLNMDRPEMEIHTVDQVRFCTSNYFVYYSGVICTIKGFLLIFGVFLAWQTRSIVIKEFNDSKYIALSVYTIAVTCAIAVPMLTVFSVDVNANFTVLGIAVTGSNTAVLLLVFLPKILLFRSSGVHLSTMPRDTVHRAGQELSMRSSKKQIITALHEKWVKKTDELEQLQEELTKLSTRTS